MSTVDLTITGFTPFPGVLRNPTQTLVASLAGSADALLRRAQTIVVPTRYGDAPAALSQVLANPPRVLIMTGYSARAAGLVLESRASNRCTPGLRDAAGVIAHDSAMPVHHLPARCDIAALCDAVCADDVPCDMSCDAGGYVCNHLYYHVLADLDRQGAETRALFVHIPAISGTALAATSAAHLSLAQMQRGIGALARALLAATHGAAQNS